MSDAPRLSHVAMVNGGVDRPAGYAPGATNGSPEEAVR